MELRLRSLFPFKCFPVIDSFVYKADAVVSHLSFLIQNSSTKVNLQDSLSAINFLQKLCNTVNIGVFAFSTKLQCWYQRILQQQKKVTTNGARPDDHWIRGVLVTVNFGCFVSRRCKHFLCNAHQSRRSRIGTKFSQSSAPQESN